MTSSIQAFCLDPYSDGKRRNDAIAASRNDDGSWTLYVYIADVSVTLGAGTRWDKDARANPTGFFVPYLAEVSLSPQQVCRVVRMKIQLTAEGKPAGMHYGRSEVQPVAALSFDQARKILEHPEYPLHEGLARIMDVGKLLIGWRKGRPVTETSIEGVVTQIMTLTNSLLTRAAMQKKRHLLYINNMPVNLTSLETESLRSGLKQAERKGPVEARAFRSAHMTGIPRTWLSPHNCGHLGLATWAHAWFTSPLHRYVDVLNWRSLLDGIDIAADEALLHEMNLRLSEMYSIKASYEVRQILECNLQTLRKQPFSSFLDSCLKAHYIPFDVEKELQWRIASDGHFSSHDAAMALSKGKRFLSLKGKGALLKWMAHTAYRLRSVLGYLIEAAVFPAEDVMPLRSMSHEDAVMYLGKHYGLPEDICREALEGYDPQAIHSYTAVFASMPKNLTTTTAQVQHLSQRVNANVQYRNVGIKKPFEVTLIWKGPYENHTVVVTADTKKNAQRMAAARLLQLLRPSVVPEAPVTATQAKPTVLASPPKLANTVEGILGERKSTLKAQIVYSIPVLIASKLQYRCLAQWTSPLTRTFEDFGWGDSPDAAKKNALWNIIVAMATTADEPLLSSRQLWALRQIAPKELRFPDVIEESSLEKVSPEPTLPKQLLALRCIKQGDSVIYSDWEKLSIVPQLWSMKLTYIEQGQSHSLTVTGESKEICKNTACQQMLLKLESLETERSL